MSKTTNNSKNKSKNKNTKKKDVKKKEIAPNKKQQKDKLDKTLELTTKIRIDKDRLNDTGTLDTSFLEKQKKAINKRKILLEEEKMKEEEEKREKKANRKKRGLFKDIILVILCISTLSLGYIVASKYVNNSCPNKTPKETKTKVEVEKVILDDNYLFLGDFLTEEYDLDKYFEGMFVVKSAYSDDKTSNFLNNLNDKVYKYNPSKIFIEVGLNDVLAEKEEEEIVVKIEELIDRIKENRPYAKVYLESIYPINSEIDDDLVEDANEKSVKINEELMLKSTEKNIEYIDIYNLLVDEDGNLDEKYTDDGKTLNDDGYDEVTKEIKKYIEEKE